jgi:vacuolar iron transporter family protein
MENNNKNNKKTISEKKKHKNTLNKKTDSKEQLNKGQLFGLISGSITTIGVIVGLWQSHNNIGIIISAILSIALSDSFSDGFGMYFSQRTHLDQTEATNIGIQTTFYKIIVTLSYIIPFLILDIDTAIKINITWGCFLIAYASYQIGEGILINLLMAVVVIFMSYLGGNTVKIIAKMIKPETSD